MDDLTLVAGVDEGGQPGGQVCIQQLYATVLSCEQGCEDASLCGRHLKLSTTEVAGDIVWH